MSEGSGQYRPGDVVNGYVLTSEHQWIPVGPSSSSSVSNPSAVPAPGAGWGYSPAPQVYVQADSAANSSLAPVTSLVSGIIGFLFCWIPFIGIIGWLFGPLALVFGLLGLSRGKAEHKIMSWIGLVLGAITLVICILYALAFASAFSES